MLSYKTYQYYFLLFLILSPVFISSCATSSVISRPKDVSSIYNPTKNTITPSFTLFNTCDTESILTISIRKAQLLFSEANSSGEPMASVTVSVRLFNNNTGGILCDSVTYDFDIKKDPSLPEFICRVPLKVYNSGSYYSIISIYDKIKQKVSRSYFSFKKSDEFDPYNYKVYSHFEKREVFTRVLHKDEYVNVRYPSKSIDTIFLFYYKPVKSISPAPSVILPEVTTGEKADGFFILPYRDTLPLMFPREGIYLFSVDSTKNEGVTLFNFGPEFPGMRSAETMIPPLAYIATEDELTSLNNASDKKIALDNFWLDHSGNIEKAKELIRIYYFRVQFANIYFSSYKIGWLTDRGMIYVMYGPPDIIHKTGDTEKWGYMLPAVKSHWNYRFSFDDQYLWFTFRKQDNKFTENDYTLNRSQTPVSYWDQAVSSWRHGNVFRLDNPKEYQ